MTYILSDRIPKQARSDAEKHARRHLERASKSLSKAASALGRRDIKVFSELCQGQPYLEIIQASAYDVVARPARVSFELP